MNLKDMINQYFIDPCKIQSTTPRLNPTPGKFFFGVSVNVLINYLRDNRIVTDKCDLNPIVFLMTPAERMAKMLGIVNKIIKFEKLVMIIALWREYYLLYMKNIKIDTEIILLAKLYLEMHDFYKKKKCIFITEKIIFKKVFTKSCYEWPKSKLPIYKKEWGISLFKSEKEE